MPQNSKYFRLSSSSQQTIRVGDLRNNSLFWYILYLSAIFLVICSAVIFWLVGSARPVLFSVGAGAWILSNPGFTTAICTITGTVLASFTVWLLNSLLVLMAKQVIVSKGTSITVIEFWHKMFNKDFIFDSKRPGISALTLAFWLVVLYLSTAYTTLITPTNVLVSSLIRGSELDLSSEQFWQWYNYRDASGNFNRTSTGCGWTKYKDTILPKCIYNNVPSNFLQAGFTSAQNKLDLARDPAINYLDKHFAGSTGGVLPYGRAGFTDFSDVQFEDQPDQKSTTNYNYTLFQQGLTANISCETTEDSPINSRHIQYINNTILGLPDGVINYINFTWTCPDGQRVASSGEFTSQSGTAQIVTPKESWATLVVCQNDDSNLHEYTVFVGAFGTYATDKGEPGVASFFPNMTCGLEPTLTNTTVFYSSTDDLFRITNYTLIPGSSLFVPNETYQAVDRAFSLAISNSENMVIDSIHGFTAIDHNVSIPAAMEYTLKGYIEFFATSLRMYYASNEPPGRREISGNYTVWRIGYNGQPLALAGLLPPLLLISALTIAYTIIGLRTKLDHFPDFDPVNSVSMLAASAAGGNAGKFPIASFGLSVGEDDRALQMLTRYDRVNGFMEITGKPSMVALEPLKVQQAEAGGASSASQHMDA